MPPDVQSIEQGDSSTDHEVAASPAALQGAIDDHHVDLNGRLEQSQPLTRNEDPINSEQVPPSPNGIDLTALSRVGREALYQDEFDRVMPIELLARPPQCDSYPHYANEIQHAYFKHATFIFNVWANYDACEKKFYTDERSKTCGQLILTPKSEGHLESLKADKALFRNVRFDIGTPFQVMARVTIEVRSSNLTVGPKLDLFTHDLTDWEHHHFKEFLSLCCHEIEDNEDDLTAGKNGFLWEDLHKLAEIFTMWPSDHAQRLRSRWAYKGPYTSLPCNYGY